MDRNTATSVRGIMSVLIVLSHMGEYYLKIGKIFAPWGGCFGVAVFYMFSGYNLAYSTKNTDNYLEGFIIKKIVRVFIPCYVCYLLYSIVVDECFSVNTVMKFFVLNYDCGFFWYCKAIIYIYVVYYVVYRIMLKIRKSDLKILGLLVWIISAIFISFISTNMDGFISPGFIIGWFVGLKRIKLYNKLKKLQLLFILVSFLGVVIFLGTYLEGGFRLVGLYRYLGVFLWMIFWLFVTCYYIIKNKLLCILGEISYELYLVHPILLKTCEKYKVGACVYVISVFMGGIIIALIMAKIDVLFYNRIKNKMV